MGWNDHVEFIWTECQDCGETDDWEYWGATGRQRYVGAIGAMLGVNAERSGKCPHCGSTNGTLITSEW
jgi:hypothetical protein